MSETPTMPLTCIICGGAEGEHKDSIHAFTTTPGQLVTTEEMKKSKNGEAPSSQRMPFMVPNMGSPVVDRLISLLIDKGMLNSEEALYVLTGRPIS